MRHSRRFSRPIFWLIPWVLFTVQFSAFALQNQWTGAAGDNSWFNSTNWSLGVLPDATQDVLIEQTGTNSVFVGNLAEVNSLTLGGAIGTASLYITNGGLSCDNSSIIHTNGSLYMLGGSGVVIRNGSFTLEGTSYWTGGAFQTFGTSTFDITASGVLSIGAVELVAGSFNNYGQFVLQHDFLLTQTYPPTLPSSFNNYGSILVPTNTGPVTFQTGSALTNYGTIRADTNSTLSLVIPSFVSGIYLSDGTIFDGNGTVQVSCYFTIECAGHITVNCTLQFNDNADGPSYLSGSGLFKWHSGLNNFTFGPDFHVEIAGGGGPGFSGSCTNQGVIRWPTAGYLLTGFGNTTAFYNEGRFSIGTNSFWDPGITLFNQPGGTLQILSGTSTLQTLTNRGMFDFEGGTLNIQNLAIADGGGTYQATLSGYDPGIGFGQTSASSMAIGNSLVVTLTNGFVPTNGSSFTLASASTLTGQFSSLTLPALSGNLAWHVRYGSGALKLLVAPPLTVTNASVLPDGTFQLDIAGPPADAYDIQTSTNLLDWQTVETNSPFSGSLIFNDTNATQFNQRFYRTRIFY